MISHSVQSWWARDWIGRWSSTWKFGMIAGLKGLVTVSTKCCLLTVSPQGTNMRLVLLHVSVNDLDDREFSRRKPASDTKPGDGRYAGGHAEKNLTFSRACRNEVSGASESLTRTSLKPWCSSTENGLSGWKLSLIVPRPNLSLSAQQQVWRQGTNQNTRIRKCFHFHCIGTDSPKRWGSFYPGEIFKTQLVYSATWFGWIHFEQDVGLDDLQRSFPTSLILWFSNSINTLFSSDAEVINTTNPLSFVSQTTGSFHGNKGTSYISVLPTC